MLRKIFFILISLMVYGLHGESSQSNLIEILPGENAQEIARKAAGVVPTPRQLAYLEREYIGFIHFGVNTFTAVEWGDGFEDPVLFAPGTVDTDQWARIMKEAGMTTVVLTVKHHDGFCLWPTRYTGHSVAASPGFEGGEGDVLRSLSKSLQKYGLKLGVYLSPADLYQIEQPDGLYGNGSKVRERVIPRPVEGRAFEDSRSFRYEVDDYNEYFLNQLFEILTEYGPVYEVWFDGAHPKTKGGQEYAYQAWYEMIRELAPEAVIFGKGPDVRWCGNEGGGTRESEWNVIPLPVHPDRFDWPDMTAEDLGSIERLVGARYLYYLPTEINTSIRHGWFYQDDTHQQVRSAADLFDIYERSVGGNSVFMLNIPPNRQGRFSPRDEAALIESGRRIREVYQNPLISPSSLAPVQTDDRLDSYSEAVMIPFQSLPGSRVNRLVLQEATPVKGQRVESFRLEVYESGDWKELAGATTIGFKKILRFPETELNRFRVVIESSRLTPAIAEVGLYYAPSYPPSLEIRRSRYGRLRITPVVDAFTWKSNGIQDSMSGVDIYYTLDGTNPVPGLSERYSGSFRLPDGGRIKARAFNGAVPGPLLDVSPGIAPSRIRFIREGGFRNASLIRLNRMKDRRKETSWVNFSNLPLNLSFDLGEELLLNGFSWLPPQGGLDVPGRFEAGRVEVKSESGEWRSAGTFQFGNVVNDPSLRHWNADSPIRARYVRIIVEKSSGESSGAGAAEFEFHIGR